MGVVQSAIINEARNEELALKQENLKEQTEVREKQEEIL